MTEWAEVYQAFMEARPVLMMALALVFVPKAGDPWR